MNTPTPRTDEAEKPTDGDYYLDGTVPSEHARILERENIALQAHVERLAEALEKLSAWNKKWPTDVTWTHGSEGELLAVCHDAENALTLYRAERPKK